MKTPKPWTRAQALFAIENYGEMTAQAIGNRIGRSRRAVIGFLDRYAKRGLPEYCKPKSPYTNLVDLRPNQCRYIDDGNRYCCDNDKASKSYCSEHHYVIYVRNERK